MDCSRIRISILCCVATALFLWGCASSPRFVSNGGRNPSETRPSPQGHTRPSPNGRVLLTLEGLASYYADDFHGKQTSNGETYDMYGLTAAHRNLPFGTRIRVTNLENDKTVEVRVNDRGPFHEDRIIDLTLGAARALGFEKRGTARVRLEVLEWGEGK